MKRRPMVASMALLLTPLAFAGGNNPSKETAGTERPEMSFRLSTYHGKSPLEVTLTAQIKQPSARAMKSCWIRADWENTTGVGLPFRSRKEIPCAGEKAEIKVPGSFEKTLHLEKAGTYSYRIILEDHEGKRYASASREVKVLEGGVGIRIGKTVDER